MGWHPISAWRYVIGAATAPEITALLRSQGLWTNLHDRSAEYAPFLRAQEHSAQIDRPVLQIYEQRFKDGRINILNCTTTMEMGVDIPNVALVVNANVPPSVSNYRQRVGRAGRRGEAFAFAVTFCRDLPWDEIAFAAPPQYLAAPIAAPSVSDGQSCPRCTPRACGALGRVPPRPARWLQHQNINRRVFRRRGGGR